MNNNSLTELYKIDKQRLLNYYNRIKNQNRNEQKIHNVAKFLINQSIGTSFREVYDTLKHFEGELIENKELLDLAFEWIRAQKIRLEYKKYLIRAKYPNNDLCLAVDDCIYRFFLKHDKYIRNLFKKELREHNFSALYEIFFSPFESKSLIIEDVLQKHIHNIPTHYCGSQKINTRIMTLREGLSNIIVKDYEHVLIARKEDASQNNQVINNLKKPVKKSSAEFVGSNIERIIKTYCFTKREISEREIEGSISNFLNSYFKFGTFYQLEEFRDALINDLAEYVHSGLTDNTKKMFPIEDIKQNILLSIEINGNKKLDGSAWITDLKPILINFLSKFIANLFKSLGI
jgi:hypothetical protein